MIKIFLFVSFCSVLKKQARVTCENESDPLFPMKSRTKPRTKTTPSPLHPNNNKTQTNNNKTKKQQQQQWKLNW